MAKINLVSNLNSTNIDTIVTLYTFCMVNVIVVVATHAFNKALCYFKGCKVNWMERSVFSPLPVSKLKKWVVSLNKYSYLWEIIFWNLSFGSSLAG